MSIDEMDPCICSGARGSNPACTFHLPASTRSNASERYYVVETAAVYTTSFRVKAASVEEARTKAASGDGEEVGELEFTRMLSSRDWKVEVDDNQEDWGDDSE